ncbi:MAG: serine/threonine protein kinase [Planctomycetia bacterium]|nr:serine/threonine protein kinase [Planctomycetia bacterium]
MSISSESLGPAAPLVDVDDQQLANKLVAIGHLNRWQADQLLAGRIKFNLGQYQIIDSIGQGGMGQVFKAEHMYMGRVVAVKVLPKARSTPDAIAGFSHEIRAQTQLDHANLVRAYDAGHDGSVYFLVTEYVPGTDLRQLVLRRGRLGQREAATIVSQVARGLDHAHHRGLIHRDVKPGNVLVTPDGHAKLSDLGLVGFSSPEAAHEDPRSGRTVGTADYLAPEVIASPRKVSAASDIYSLGCTLYYAVTGKVPFPGGTTREKCYRHCNETPLHPRRFNPELSDEFLDVLADMMEKDPARRIATAVDVLNRLSPWADEAISPLPPARESFARATPPALPQRKPPRSSTARRQSLPRLPSPNPPNHRPADRCCRSYCRRRWCCWLRSLR